MGKMTMLTENLAPVFPVVEFWEDHFVNYFAHKTIYRGPPTLEREMAWSDLWFRGFPLSLTFMMKVFANDSQTKAWACRQRA